MAKTRAERIAGLAETIATTPDMAGDKVSIPLALRDLPRSNERAPDKYDRLFWSKVREGKIQPPKWSKPGDYKP